MKWIIERAGILHNKSTKGLVVQHMFKANPSGDDYHSYFGTAHVRNGKLIEITWLEPPHQDQNKIEIQIKNKL